jgi:hypothetical protein
LPLKIHYLHPAISAHAPTCRLKKVDFLSNKLLIAQILSTKEKEIMKILIIKKKKKEQLKLPCLEK